MRTIGTIALLLFAGCTTPEQRGAQAAEAFGPRCEKLGHSRDSEAWRACVRSEEMNEALATQRAYDQDFLRKRDCIDPRFGCASPMR